MESGYGLSYRISEDTEATARDRQKYLELRQRLKELERQKLKQKFNLFDDTPEHSKNRRKSLPYNDSYGSFFGLSQPVIAKRIIEETCARLETAKISIQMPGKGLHTACLSDSTKSVCKKPAPKAPAIQTMTKAQQLKAARDYSFLLSEDAEVPHAPRITSEIPRPASPHNFRPKETISSKPIPLKKPGMPTSKPIAPAAKEPKCVVSSSREMASKIIATKPTAMESPTIQKTSSDAKKQVGTHRGNDVSGVVISADVTYKKKTSLTNKNKPAQNTSVKHPESVPQKPTPIHKPPAFPKAPPIKPVAKVQVDKPIQKPVAPKQVPKPAPKPPEKLPPKPSKLAPKPASKPAEKTSVKPAAAEKPAPKKRARYDDLDEDLDEGGDYRSLIRQMFGYNPNKYGHDDGDDRGMEVGFSSIQAEERRSARIAREEDERELELIEAEERAEKARAKKRRLKKKQ